MGRKGVPPARSGYQGEPEQGRAGHNTISCTQGRGVWGGGDLRAKPLGSAESGGGGFQEETWGRSM